MKNRKITLMITAYIVILILIGIMQPHETDWRPTFAAGDKIPFGTYILRERLEDLFPGDSVITATESVSKTLHKKHYQNTNYILIEPHWNGSRNDIQELLGFAQQGNNVFIASQYLSYKFLDTLGIYQHYQSLLSLAKLNKKDSANLTLTLSNSASPKDSDYIYEGNNIPESFSPTKSTNIKTDISEDDDLEAESDSTETSTFSHRAIVLSTMSHTHPIFIRIPYGRGNIYLHSYPFAFTNYYLIKDSTRRYAEQCLSYLPKGKVLWDEHYKSNSRYRHMSTLQFILTNESLRWAYYTGALFMIIFVIFSIKRRQRIIPVVDPFRNTTLEFTETVGRLYFNRGDHHNIAEKKIRHFLEYVRSRYYIDTQDLNEEYINKLASKSGIEKDRVQYMTAVMRELLSKKSIADTELIQLNELIEYFKNHSH